MCSLAGNLLVHELPVLPGIPWCVLLGSVAVALFFVGAMRPLAWMTAGFLWTAGAAHAELAHRLPAAYEGRDIELSGWVDDFPSVNETRTIFSLRVDPESVDLPLERLRLSWYDEAPELRPAARLRLSVRLRHPRGTLNPGGFDYERWLFVEGYSATGYVRHGETESGAGLTPGGRWLALRTELARRIESTVGCSKAAALLAALAIGERSGFSDAQWADFRRTGTSHLVAISGLHISLVATFFFVIAGSIARRCGPVFASRDLEIAALAAFCGGFSYAALAGFALPTLRALVMLAFALVVLCSRRYTSGVGGISAALLCLLLFDPLATLTASFWMSFAAVLVLLGLVNQRTAGSRAHRLIDSLRPVGRLLRLQCWLTIALVPLNAVFFGEISILALAVNAIAIPFFSFVLVPATMLSVLVLPLASWPLELTAPLAACALATLRWFSAWDLASFALPSPGRWPFLVAVAGVVLALPWHRCPGRNLAWLALCPLFYPVAIGRLSSGELSLLLLDVGHGLAAVVETQNFRLLYDAGARTRSGFDSGLEVVVPALRTIRHRALDMLLVSHGDNDHIGGVSAVLEAFPDATVLHGPDVTAIEGQTCATGQEWNRDGVEFLILHPGPDFPWRGNESSCVLRVSSKFGSILITGDIEARAELALSGRGDLRTDAVVVPHHGSATSSSQELVRQTQPALALVSAGFNNRWGFPVDEVSERWRGAGARLLVTGDVGAIRLRFGESGLELVMERDRRRRYWHAESGLTSGESMNSTL